MKIQECACETIIGEYIHVKDICLLVRRYMADIPGSYIAKLLKESTAFPGDMRIKYRYNPEDEMLSYMTYLWGGPVAKCPPSDVINYLKYMTQLPERVERYWMPNAIDALIKYANSTGRELEERALLQCHYGQ